jgi:hypothetical protein
MGRGVSRTPGSSNDEGGKLIERNLRWRCRPTLLADALSQAQRGENKMAWHQGCGTHSRGKTELA